MSDTSELLDVINSTAAACTCNPDDFAGLDGLDVVAVPVPQRCGTPAA